MKIFLVERTDDGDYDQFDSFVCIAKNEHDAKHTHPDYDSTDVSKENTGLWDGKKERFSEWTDIENVTATYIGEAKDDSVRSVVCSSYNAG